MYKLKDNGWKINKNFYINKKGKKKIGKISKNQYKMVDLNPPEQKLICM